jgi:cellulose synthase/poly-beta-1,6-N-acetylglucosamine synthase-like glycosyltransferase
MFLFWMAQAIAIVLLATSLRRAVLLVAACLPTPAPSHASQTPTLLILIPCRNEAPSLPGLFAALDQLDYPRDRMRVVIVDDGSTDDTPDAARAMASSRPWVEVRSLGQNAGKAGALNEGLTSRPVTLRFAQSDSDEAVVIYDADHRPLPNSLRALVAPLGEGSVAAVSGQMRVVNGRASAAAFYALVESYVNQLITMRGKDRLNLAPAILGSNCAYRRSALEAVGGFRPGALLEDSDLTLAFALAGWRTRFALDSISEHHAPTSLRGYLRQHLRWNRGFHQVSRGRLPTLWANPKLSLWLKLELTFFALGYADRLALLAGAAFSAIDYFRPDTFGFPVWVWPIYFGLPAVEMAAALVVAREPLSLFPRLVYAPFFFVFDIAIAVWSSVLTFARRPLRWNTTERPSAQFTTPNTKSAKKIS